MNSLNYGEHYTLYLRKTNELDGFKIELERPITYFDIRDSNISNIKSKKEIDLSIYDSKTGQKFAVEIKFSKNGAVPMQMFKFCEDISFLEILVNNGFNKGYSLVIVDRDDFVLEKNKTDGIYDYFRGNEHKPITNDIICPTGKHKSETIKIKGVYNPKWEKLKVEGSNRYYYYLVEVIKIKK